MQSAIVIKLLFEDGLMLQGCCDKTILQVILLSNDSIC